MRIKKSTFKKILARKLNEMLQDVETPADVEPVEDVWAGCPDAGNLELDIDFSKAAGSEPVTDEQEVMVIVQQEVRKYLRQNALKKKIHERNSKAKLGLRHVAVMSNTKSAPVPVQSRASAALRNALRGEDIPNKLMEAMELFIDRNINEGKSESFALNSLRREVNDFIHLWRSTSKK